MLWRYSGETNSRNGWKDDPLVNTDDEIIIRTRNLSVHYNTKPAVLDINLDIARHKITALIGPSGCGKSTLLRCFNRMNDLIPRAQITGQVLFKGHDLYAPEVDPTRYATRLAWSSKDPIPSSNPFTIMSPLAPGLMDLKAT